MKFLCYFGIHLWKTKREKHKVINHPDQREFVRIIVRECESCGRRQYTRRTQKKTIGFHWKKCIFDKDSTINIVEIN